MDTTLIRIGILALLFAPAVAAQDRQAGQGLPENGTVQADAVVTLHPISHLTRRAAATEAQAKLLEATSGAEDQLAQRDALSAATKSADAMAAGLMAMVQAYCEPALNPDGGTLVDLVLGAEDALIVIGTPAQQTWVKGFLALQVTDGSVIDVQAHVLSVPAGQLASLGFPVGGQPALLEAGEAGALLAQLKSGGGQVVTAPRLLTLPRQRGSVSIINEQSYVTDWEVRVVQPGDQLLADPVIDTLQEGVTSDVQVVLLPDDLLGVDVTLTHSDVVEPVDTVPWAPDATATDEERMLTRDLTVSLADVHQVSATAQLVTVSGATMLLTVAGLEADQDLAVLVSAKRILPEGAGR